MKTPPRYWFGRLTLTLWVLTVPVITLLEPDTLTARTLTNPPGWVCLLALIAAGSVSLADLVLNDTPGGQWFPMGLNLRHMVYMGMAIILVLQVGVITQKIGFSAIVLTFMLPAMLLVVLTFLDIKARHRAKKATP